VVEPRALSARRRFPVAVRAVIQPKTRVTTAAWIFIVGTTLDGGKVSSATRPLFLRKRGGCSGQRSSGSCPRTLLARSIAGGAGLCETILRHWSVPIQAAHSEDGREVQPVLETGTGTTRTDHCEKTPKRRKTTDVVEWGEIDVRPGFPCDQDEAEKVWPVTIWPLSARPWAWYGWSRAWSKVVITAPVVVEETDEANGRGPGKPCCKPHGQSASTILQATGDGTLTVSIVGPEVRGQVEAHSAFLGFPALRSRKKVAKDVLQ